MLWSLFYGYLLWFELHPRASVVGYVDDVAVVATAHNAPIIEDILYLALKQVVEWLARNGLGLAPEKTEVVMLTRKWVFSPPVVHIGGHRIPFFQDHSVLGSPSGH